MGLKRAALGEGLGVKIEYHRPSAQRSAQIERKGFAVERALRHDLRCPRALRQRGLGGGRNEQRSQRSGGEKSLFHALRLRQPRARVYYSI